jgi:SAM-dependent methyltransferase
LAPALRARHKDGVPDAKPPLLFDRALIAQRLERAYRAAGANPSADFLLRRAAEELGDRLSLVRRVFPVAAEVGSAGPHGAETLAARNGGGFTLRLAPAALGAGRGAYECVVGDIERLPLAEASCDLIVSLLALQHVNDLPGALIQMRRALKPDGLFVAALAGGDTLTELRQSLTFAESEILGGAAPRVAPFADVRALGALMQRAGFALPVVDADPAVARYADLFALMRDLRAFGATNALILRSRKPLRRDVLLRAAAVYAERFADPDGRLRATFDTVWLTGWAPHPSQPKPLKPGSAAMRLADALNVPRDER